jgi:predicted dehydrogenase
MTPLRLGIVGVGNIGGVHAQAVRSGQVTGLQLAAVCDVKPQRLAAFPDVPRFESFERMLAEGNLDAVVVATPHFHHVPQAIAALRAGLHVLVEKPVSVHKAEVARLLAAHTQPRLVLAAMFNQRTDPRYLKLRELVQGGSLGTPQRIHWTVTNWFRTEHYYASGDWRATWSGEGGGVLLNQCPHNLDLFQWIFGLPQRVHARCRFGRTTSRSKTTSPRCSNTTAARSPPLSPPPAKRPG